MNITNFRLPNLEQEDSSDNYKWEYDDLPADISEIVDRLDEATEGDTGHYVPIRIFRKSRMIHAVQTHGSTPQRVLPFSLSDIFS